MMRTSTSKQHYLKDLRDISCQWVGAYHGPVPHPGSWYGLRNPACILWFLEAGTLRVETEAGSNTYHSDTFILQMPGLRLNQIFSADAELISLRFHVKWPNGRLLFRTQQQERSCSVGQYPALKQASLAFLDAFPQTGHGMRYDAIAMEADDAWAIAAAEARLLQHWYRCACDVGFRLQDPYLGDARVARGVEILQEHLAQRDVPYQDLQQGTGLSRAQLDRIFQQHLGHSPKREHDLLRLAHAQEQLQIRERAIKQIAADLGFFDASQFAKWFRRLDGRNPRQARYSNNLAV